MTSEVSELSDELLASLANEAGNEGWDDVKLALTELQRRRAEARQEPGAMRQLRDRPELIALIEKAKARFAAMSPDEQEAELLAQRESWVRGEMAMSETAAVVTAPSPRPAAVTEEMVEEAEKAFNLVINDPQMVPCEKCGGKGYHHGFGEDGASPDWCLECGGNQYNVVPGEERRAMRAALEAALASRPAETWPFSSALKAAEAYIEEYEWNDGESYHVPTEVERAFIALLSTPQPAGEVAAYQHRGRKYGDRHWSEWRDGRNQSFDTADGDEFEERPLYALPPAPQTAHPEDACTDCGHANPVWSAPNDLWNEVMGGPDGIVCPACFAARAAAKGIRPVWSFAPRSETEPDAVGSDHTDLAWRDLALQFDAHRIEALALLRYVSEAGNIPEATSRIGQIRPFLAKPPLAGEAVLAQRIAALHQPVPGVVEALRDLRGLFDSNGYLFCDGDYQFEVIAKADAALASIDEVKE